MKNRLRVLRAEREWSQAELADRTNVSRQTIEVIFDPGEDTGSHT
jgi:putative transcriptional regulator